MKNTPGKKQKKERLYRKEIERVRFLILDPRNGCPDIERGQAEILLKEIDRLMSEVERLKKELFEAKNRGLEVPGSG
jgi:hypothetical protein